jgi:hypothetical protein
VRIGVLFVTVLDTRVGLTSDAASGSEPDSSLSLPRPRRCEGLRTFADGALPEPSVHDEIVGAAVAASRIRVPPCEASLLAPKIPSPATFSAANFREGLSSRATERSSRCSETTRS